MFEEIASSVSVVISRPIPQTYARTVWNSWLGLTRKVSPVLDHQMTLLFDSSSTILHTRSGRVAPLEMVEDALEELLHESSLYIPRRRKLLRCACRGIILARLLLPSKGRIIIAPASLLCP